MSDDFIFTSESITRGHPDKLCDQVSDAIVDHFLRQDRHASIVAECSVSSGILFIAARYASVAKLDIPDVARHVIREIGYPKRGLRRRHLLDHDQLRRSHRRGVRAARPRGFRRRGDRPLHREAPGHRVRLRLRPNPQPDAAADLAGPSPGRRARLRRRRRRSSHTCSRTASPRSASSTAAANRNGSTASPWSRASWQRTSRISAELRKDLIEHVIGPVCEEAKYEPDADTRIYVNPEGALIGGGPSYHSGLTGRKTGVDTYGEYARHSGAALSGKDPMRIDRVAAYAARYAAKNVVAARLAEECEVSLSYSVGVAAPVSVRVRTFGSGDPRRSRDRRSRARGIRFPGGGNRSRPRAARAAGQEQAWLLPTSGRVRPDGPHRPEGPLGKDGQGGRAQVVRSALFNGVEDVPPDASLTKARVIWNRFRQ